jgi:hypothetical protein
MSRSLTDLPVSQAQVRDVAAWTEWVNSHSLIAAKLKGADRNNLPAYFQSLHAATEALFRQTLFVGLRLNHVTYKEAQDWLHLHDKTPDKTDYPKLFNRLYASKAVVWATLVAQHPRLELALELWHEFSKDIRNHLAHGKRSYSIEWLETAIHIDQHLLIELDLAMEPVVGGSIAKHLTQLSPRLPVGKTGPDFFKLTGVKQKQPRPKLSLVAAQKQLEGLGSPQAGNRASP